MPTPPKKGGTSGGDGFDSVKLDALKTIVKIDRVSGMYPGSPYTPGIQQKLADIMKTVGDDMHGYNDTTQQEVDDLYLEMTDAYRNVTEEDKQTPAKTTQIEVLDNISTLLKETSPYPPNHPHQFYAKDKTYQLKQSQIDGIAEKKTARIDGSILMKIASKHINDPKNKYNTSKPYAIQMETFAAYHGHEMVKHIIKTEGSYEHYTKIALEEYVKTHNDALVLTYTCFSEIVSTLCSNLDTFVSTGNTANELSRSFARITSDNPRGLLGARLDALIEATQDLGTASTNEEKIGRFNDTRFRETYNFDSHGRRTATEMFETPMQFISRVVDAMTDANIGCPADKPLVSADTVLSTIRYQLTAKGIHAAIPCPHERNIVANLVDPITANRTNAESHTNTATVAGLTAIARQVDLKSRQMGWKPPSEASASGAKRRQQQQTAVAAVTNAPQQTNTQQHIPTAQPSAPHSSPAGAAFNANAGRGNANPGTPNSGFPQSRPKNPDGSFNCVRCGKSHFNASECEIHEGKVGPSPWKGVKTNGMLVCLACGLPGHPMRSCPAAKRPAHVSPNTAGYTYYGIDGPAHVGNAGNLGALAPPFVPSAPSTQSGHLANSRAAALLGNSTNGAGYDMMPDDASVGNHCDEDD